MTNINDPVFDEPRERPGFRCLRARLSRHATRFAARSPHVSDEKAGTKRV